MAIVNCKLKATLDARQAFAELKALKAEADALNRSMDRLLEKVTKVRGVLQKARRRD